MADMTAILVERHVTFAAVTIHDLKTCILAIFGPGYGWVWYQFAYANLFNFNFKCEVYTNNNCF